MTWNAWVRFCWKQNEMKWKQNGMKWSYSTLRLFPPHTFTSKTLFFNHWARSEESLWHYSGQCSRKFVSFLNEENSQGAGLALHWLHLGIWPTVNGTVGYTPFVLFFFFFFSYWLAAEGFLSQLGPAFVIGFVICSNEQWGLDFCIEIQY